MASKPVKITLWTIGGILALLIVVGGVCALYLTYRAKPEVQSVASDALGVDVTVGGAIEIGVLPSPHLTLKDVHLRSQHSELASAGSVSLGVELAPLFHHQIRITQIGLKRVRISLERDKSGELNLHGFNGDGPLPDLEIARVSASQVQVHYQDDRTGNGFDAQDCNVDLNKLRLLTSPDASWVKSVSFTGKTVCARFTLMTLNAANVALSIEGSDGVLDINPFSLQLFDGHGNGSIRVDLTHQEPFYQVRYALSGFSLEQFSKTLSPDPVGTGALDFTSNLAMRGATIPELTSSASGNATLRGTELTLQLGDLDRKFDQFESTQNFNLVDAGAFLLAGPIGLGLSKGYDYARVLHMTPGTTPVRTIVSEWRVEKGTARATDVALATARHRVALKGGLNFVTREFDDVTVALVNPDGCAAAEQKVHGPFVDPKADRPSILGVIAGPTRRLFGKATSLLGHKCVSFYSGSVEAPQ